MFVAYIFIACVISYIICRKNFDFCLWACCVFLLLSGLGFNINEEYRMGNIMIADIGLLLFALMLFLHGGLLNAKMKKKKAIMLLILVAYLILGIAIGNSIEYILRDVKNFLYFMLPAFYFSDIKKIPYKLNCVFKVFLISIVYTLCLCLNEFFFVSGIAVGGDAIQKYYGLGLGADFLFFFAVVVMLEHDYFSKKITLLGWILLELALVFGAFSSFVRSSWLVMVVVTLCGMVIAVWQYIHMKQKITLKMFLSFMVALIVVLSIGGVFVKKLDVDVFGIAKERFATIKIIDIDENDTLAARIDDVMANVDDLKSPIMIIGHGLGAIMTNSSGAISGSSAENSFMYYSIKFGYPLFIYMCVVVCKYLYKIFGREDLLNKLTAVFLAVSMVVQAMSGNLNKYYISPFFIMLIVLNMKDVVNAFEHKEDMVKLVETSS